MSLIGTPVDIREMVGPHRVVIFGESSHNPRAYKTEVLNSLPALAKMGFGLLALEMLPSDMNPVLGTAGSDTASSGHLKQYWDRPAPLGGTVSQDYINIIAKARQQRMKVVALDMPYEDFDRFSCTTTFKECTDTTHFARNRHMADHLARLLRGGKKIVVFMHYWHAVTRSALANGRAETGIKQLLTDKGFSSVLIKLVGGGSPMPSSGPSDLPVEIAARAAGAESKRFYVAGSGPRNEDYTIHLPQSWRFNMHLD